MQYFFLDNFEVTLNILSFCLSLGFHPREVQLVIISILLLQEQLVSVSGPLSCSSITWKASQGRIRWAWEDQRLYVCLVIYLEQWDWISFGNYFVFDKPFHLVWVPLSWCLDGGCHWVLQLWLLLLCHAIHCNIPYMLQVTGNLSF